MIQLSDQAMPGDQVRWECPSHGLCWATVKNVKAQPTSNGGKIFVYECEDGELIPFDKVKEIKYTGRAEFLKSLPPKPDHLEDVEAKAYFKILIENFELPSDLKTAVACILENDKENLNIAFYLIQKRLKLIEKT